MTSIGLERASFGGIFSVTTDASGTAFVQLHTVDCNQVTLVNDSGTSLDFGYCAPGGVAQPNQTTLKVLTGTSQPLRGITNANQLFVRRNDHSGTPVTVNFIVEKSA